MDRKLWLSVPYMRPLRNTCKWQAEIWKGAPPAKIDGRMSFFEPESALASHLEGVRIAGKLDEYILGIKEKGWSRSKKTRDRKAGLSKVLMVMESWEGYAKYEAVQQVMEAVKSSQSSWLDTPDPPTKRAKRGGADTTEGSGGVGGELNDMLESLPEHMRNDMLEQVVSQMKLQIQDQMKATGAGTDTTTGGVGAKRKSEEVGVTDSVVRL